ncbi:hypothetical protein ACIB15232_0165 [Aliarcobacter cibarius]|uniref:dynamin family protein n=1 Tax=Aliarcobacter cibarius TaxID=255507 RepID=UPI001245844A|nr:dynamin family protein [Aliarcobacter cibarius]QEZ88362.1 hypothetical protein ACIB15232_0165 [Aliarcobacter cibarius]
MNEITVENIKNELLNFEKHILEMENENYLMQEYKESINDLKEKLLRAKKELTNQVYFLAVIGSIKTGKSTLINLLCSSNEEVSTTQTGRETTKRPVIISAGNKEVVKIFRSKNKQEINDVRHKIIDYIKGIDDKIDTFYIEEVEFETTNVQKYLTSNQDELVDGSDIVLIQILISPTENILFNNNVMFIDTPGLDGVISSVGGVRDENESKENQGDWLLKRVHLAILLQSTVSPLNNEIKDYLEQIHKRIEATPTYMLLHNKFALKNWLIENEIEDNSIKARNKTKEILEPILKYSLKTNEVDLAKAVDGLKKDKKLKDSYTYDLLFEDSKFITFQKEVEKYITDNKNDDIHNKVRKSIIGDLTEIKFEENFLKDCTNKFDKYRSEYNEIKEMFSWSNQEEIIIKHLDSEKDINQYIDDGFNLTENLISIELRDNGTVKFICETLRTKFRDILSEEVTKTLTHYLMTRNCNNEGKILSNQIDFYKIKFKKNTLIKNYIYNELLELIGKYRGLINKEIDTDWYKIGKNNNIDDLIIKANNFRKNFKDNLILKLKNIFIDIQDDLCQEESEKLKEYVGEETDLYKTKQFFEELNKVLNNLKEVVK